MLNSNCTWPTSLAARVVPLVESGEGSRAWRLVSRSSELLTARLLAAAPGPAKFLALVGNFEIRHGRAWRGARLSRQASLRFGRSDEPFHRSLARDLDALAEALEVFGKGQIGGLGLAAGDLALVQGYRRLAAGHCRRGFPERAEPFLRRALHIFQEKGPPRHPELAALCFELAESCRALGRYGDAVEALHQALDIYDGLVTARHPGLLPTLRRLASLYFEIGDAAAAEPVLIRIREIHRHCLDTRHPGFAHSQNDLADLLVLLGRKAEAEALYCEAVEILQCHPTAKRRLPRLFLALAHLHRMQKRPVAAEAAFHRAWKTAAAALGKHHVTAGRIANDLGTFYHDQGRLRAARALYEHAAGVLRQSPRARFATLGGCLRNLALLCRQQGDGDHAEELDREYVSSVPGAQSLGRRASNHPSG